VRRVDHLRYLPVEPLRNAIRLKLDEFSEYHILGASSDSNGRMELARNFSDRFGGDEKTARRQIERILHTTQAVHEEQADRWCTVLGLHLDLLWDRVPV